MTSYWSRMKVPQYKAWVVDFEEKVAMATKLQVVRPNEIGATLAQFSLAWILANKHMPTALLGFTTTTQSSENVKALTLHYRSLSNNEANLTSPVVRKQPEKRGSERLCRDAPICFQASHHMAIFASLKADAIRAVAYTSSADGAVASLV